MFTEKLRDRLLGWVRTGLIDKGLVEKVRLIHGWDSSPVGELVID